MQTIKNLLAAKFPNILIALIYGSFGTDRETPQSDVDIAVAAAKPLKPEEKIALMTALSELTLRSIDLIDLRTASGTVLKEALVNGRIILNGNPDSFATLVSRMIFDEADFHATRRCLAEEARKRVFNE
jgi:uncharacterized protein